LILFLSLQLYFFHTRLLSFYFRLPDGHLQFGEEQDQHQSQQLNTDQRKEAENTWQKNFATTTDFI